MKIFHFTEHYFPFIGGVESAVHEICKRLVRDGFDVNVICEREKGTIKNEIIDGVKIHRVFGFEVIKLRYKSGRAAPAMLLSAIKNNADIIHAHSYGFFPTWLTVFSKKPTVITTHSDPTAKIYPLWDLFRLVPVKLCNHVVATTEMENKHLILKGIKPEKITVIPNGVALPPPLVKEVDFKSMILCLARLDIAHKGQDILLNAMPIVLSDIPDATLVIVGNGHDAEKLHKLSLKLGIGKNVKFKGEVSQSIKNLYLKNCNVFCVSPRTESFGIVYLEALAYGRPIVTTKVGGIPEVVDECAVFVPPNNPQLLAEALIQILLDKKKAKDLSNCGLNRIKKFDWDIIAKKYEKLYSTIYDK